MPDYRTRFCKDMGEFAARQPPPNQRTEKPLANRIGGWSVGSARALEDRQYGIMIREVACEGLARNDSPGLRPENEIDGSPRRITYVCRAELVRAVDFLDRENLAH